MRVVSQIVVGCWVAALATPTLAQQPAETPTVAKAPAATPQVCPTRRADSVPYTKEVPPGWKKFHYRPHRERPEAPEPQLEPAESPVMELRHGARVFARPWISGHVGTVRRGTRLKVLGRFKACPRSKECSRGWWYRVEPYGYICSRNLRPTTEPVSTGGGLRLPRGWRLPFRYVIVPKKKKANVYATEEDVVAGKVARVLDSGDSITVRGRTKEINGAKYFVARDGRLVEAAKVRWVGRGSTWKGVELKPDQRFPLAFTNRHKVPVHAAADPKAQVVEHLKQRVRVELVKEVGKFWQIGEGRFVAATDLAVIRKIAPPAGVLTSPYKQWIDVDLGEQTLVLYEHTVPVYATLVSTGRKIKTPRGNYPVWARMLTVTMMNQDYEDSPYHVALVPWVTFFQTHNAIHGCYWHNGYGRSRSHGCVNAAPLDARYVFNWIKPKLPPGWVTLRPVSLRESLTVHVRNSRLTPAFVQERPVGPPDPLLERRRLKDAERRRAREEARQAAKEAAAAAPAPAAPTPAPRPGPGGAQP